MHTHTHPRYLKEGVKLLGWLTQYSLSSKSHLRTGEAENSTTRLDISVDQPGVENLEDSWKATHLQPTSPEKLGSETRAE